MGSSSSTLSSPVAVSVSSYATLNDHRNVDQESDTMSSNRSNHTTRSDNVNNDSASNHLDSGSSRKEARGTFELDSGNATSVTSMAPLPIPRQFQNDPLAVHIHRDLPQHTIELKLGPESGRMSSTYRIRHVPSGAVMILKVMILSITIPVNAANNNNSTTTATADSVNSSVKREYGSITQHELLLQEEEMKRILLSVAKATYNNSIDIDNSSNNDNKIDCDQPASVDLDLTNDDEEVGKKHTQPRKQKKVDFSHAILPYQSWYISPFIIQSTSSLSTTNSKASATTTSSATPTKSNAHSNNTGNDNSSFTKATSFPSSSNASSASISHQTLSANTSYTGNSSQETTSQVYITQQRPIYLLRPNVYTTLSIKIITRPFLSNAEKMYIAHQIISCVHDLHSKLNLCHGHLSCENIGLSSFLSVFILDIMPVSGSGNNNRAVRPLLIPDDDPSDWIYYFQERTFSASSSSNLTSRRVGGMRRGYDDFSSTFGGAYADSANTKGGADYIGASASSSTTSNKHAGGSGGEKKCYIAPERFISKTSSSHPPTTLTPAMDIFSLGCVLMELFLNGETAMDLGDLMEYRRINGNVAEHSTLSKRLNKIESGKMRAAVRNMLHLDPTKRLSAGEYLNRLMATNDDEASSESGINDTKTSNDEGQAQKRQIGSGTVAPFPRCHESAYFPLMKHVRCRILSPDARIALAALKYEKIIQECVGTLDSVGGIYFRNLLGPKALKLLVQKEDPELSGCLNNPERIPFTSFEEFLSCHSVSVTGSNSSESLIIFVQFIISTIRYTQKPSSKVVGLQLLGRISQYASDEVRLQRIVPTIVSILHDSDAAVRAICITVLTAVLSFIDHFPPSDAQVFPQYVFKKIAHLMNDPALIVRVAFTESIALLAETALRFLDTCHAVKLYETVEGPSERETVSSQLHTGEEKYDLSASTAMIRNDYDVYVSDLQETVARWVVSITTDTSTYSSALKQALLKDITRLCHFFGHDGIMSCILPQVLAFLNHRQDWQLRASLCAHLPPICAMIGRAATEQFVVPCVETALVDEEERVVSSALCCLAYLVQMGLVTRKILLGSRSKISDTLTQGIIQKYAKLLVDSSDNVRHAAAFFVATCCRSVRFPDDEIFILPIVRPFLRYDVQRSRLQTSDGILSCLIPPSAKESRSALIRGNDSLRIIDESIEGVLKASFTCYVPNQKYAELLSNPLPAWYDVLKRFTLEHAATESEFSSLRNLSTLSNVFGVSITQPPRDLSRRYFQGNNSIFDPTLELLQRNCGDDNALCSFLSDPISSSYTAAINGEWGAEAILDPVFLEMSQDVSKLTSLEVPPKPPRLGSLRNKDGRLYSYHTPVLASPRDSKIDTKYGTDWKPKVDCLSCSSAPHEHKGPVSRLSLSQDQQFFVSGSHDGKCKVWETIQIVNTAGDLHSSLTYDGHSNSKDGSINVGARVNDLSIIENSHSVASGDSSGAVHVWRVDTFAKNSSTATNHVGIYPKTSGVSGCAMLRKVDPSEGEILSVSHFNTSAASIVAFATHKGIHSWDLRCSYEPFYLECQPEYGHLTSMTIGHDRNWLVTGTNRGFLQLWDLRFQKLVKLWQHECGAPVKRIATSMASLTNDNESKPYVVIGCGLNETSIFDVSRGGCTHCFRVLNSDLCYTDQQALPQEVISIPRFREENVCSMYKGRVNGMTNFVSKVLSQRITPPEPCIQAFTGRIGTAGENFLITGGSDGYMHYWNLSAASKCYAVSGLSSLTSRPVYEKVGRNLNSVPGTLFLCRQFPLPKINERPSSHISKAMQKGPTRPDNRHRDAILDLKRLDYPMTGILSASRDNSIKFWR